MRAFVVFLVSSLALPTSPAPVSAKKTPPTIRHDGGPSGGGSSSALLCEQEWPDDPSDPRVGVYAFHARRFPPSDPVSDPGRFLSTFSFEGTTAVVPYVGFRGLPVHDCEYGRVRDLPGIAMRRLHAHVSVDGNLHVLMPCRGWVRLGRFLPRNRFLNRHGVVSRRLDRGDVLGLAHAPLGRRTQAQLLSCSPPYEAEGQPVPLPARGG